MRRTVVLSLALTALFLAACSDDDATTPPCGCGDAVTVTLVDEAGDPVPGVLMGLASDNPYLQDVKGEKAATVIEATIPVGCRVRFTIEDIEGETVRGMIDGQWPAGRYSVTWNGMDDDGMRLDSGRYTARLRAYDLETGDLIFEDAVDMLMCIIDPVRKDVGVTDADGRIVLTDRKLFPQLYDREPMTAYDETGEAQGTLEPTATMIFTFADTVAGGGGIFRRDVDGPVDLEFVWKDSAALVSREGKEEGPVIRMPPLEDPVFSLGPVYPNPFN